MNGDYLIVGVPKSDNMSEDDGAAYLCKKVAGTWAFERTIIVEDSHEFSNFGTSLGLNEDYLFIGGFGQKDTNGNCSGAVYIVKL